MPTRARMAMGRLLPRLRSVGPRPDAPRLRDSCQAAVAARQHRPRTRRAAFRTRRRSPRPGPGSVPGGTHFFQAAYAVIAHASEDDPYRIRPGILRGRSEEHIDPRVGAARRDGSLPRHVINACRWAGAHSSESVASISTRAALSFPAAKRGAPARALRHAISGVPSRSSQADRISPRVPHGLSRTDALVREHGLSEAGIVAADEGDGRVGHSLRIVKPRSVASRPERRGRQ